MLAKEIEIKQRKGKKKRRNNVEKQTYKKSWLRVVFGAVFWLP